jgi:hypothetical protein
MVEHINDIKKSIGAKSGSHSLLDMFNNLLEYDKKLMTYTVAKCSYERNTETCILEYLYFNNRSRIILG